MEALLAILFVLGLGAIALAGSLAIDTACRVWMNGTDDKEG